MPGTARHRARSVTSAGLIKTSFHLTAELLAEVDQVAEGQSLSRAAAMEILLRLGLKERNRLAAQSEAVA